MPLISDPEFMIWRAALVLGLPGSDQPTRNMKESLESLPGVSPRHGQSGHWVQLSIRGSK